MAAGEGKILGRRVPARGGQDSKTRAPWTLKSTPRRLTRQERAGRVPTLVDTEGPVTVERLTREQQREHTRKHRDRRDRAVKIVQRVRKQWDKTLGIVDSISPHGMNSNKMRCLTFSQDTCCPEKRPSVSRACPWNSLCQDWLFE